jgi:hypothetical protein
VLKQPGEEGDDGMLFSFGSLFGRRMRRLSNPVRVVA